MSKRPFKRLNQPVRLAAVLAGLLGALLAVAGPALATDVSNTGKTEAVTTASWGAVAADTGSTAPATGTPYTVSWNTLVLDHYFSIYNTGTLALTAETYTATNSKTATFTPPPIELDACVGAAWNTTLNTCAGTTVKLAVTGQGATTTAAAIAVSGSLSVRVTPTTLTYTGTLAPFTTTISVAVSRTAVRAGLTTTS